MVETRRTPGRLFDTRGTFIKQTGPFLPRESLSTPTDAHPLCSRDVVQPRAHPSGTKTTPPTSLPPPHPQPLGFAIQEESHWRRPDILTNSNCSHLRLVAARWRGSDLSEKASEITSDYHMLSISLNRTKFHFWFGTKSVSNKEVVPGTLHLTPPGLPTRIVFHQPYDALHLFVQNALLKEYFEWLYGKSPVGDVILPDPDYACDPLIRNLGVALLSGGELGAHAVLYSDSLGFAIVARLFALCAKQTVSTAQSDVAALPTWRLRRVTNFIESNADNPITLADLAREAGLSRMHFAAQFRKATGLRPHQYLLQRRVEKAKTLLATSSAPIAEVALSVGFSSQSHFTGVFKRLTNHTPLRWRELSLA